MKKILALLMLSAMLLLTLTGCYNGSQPETTASEPAPVAAPMEGSRFENFLLKKGSLITKEFIDQKKLILDPEAPNLTEVMLQTATLTDQETGEVYKALRIKFEAINGRDFVNTVIVLDADEADSLIAALKHMNKALTAGTLKDYSEIVYTSHSGASIGICYNGSGNMFFENSDGINNFYATASIPELIGALEELKPLLETAPAPETAGEPSAT